MYNIPKSWKELINPKTLTKLSSGVNELLDELEDHFDFPEWTPGDDEMSYLATWLILAMEQKKLTHLEVNFLRRELGLEAEFPKIHAIS